MTCRVASPRRVGLMVMPSAHGPIFCRKELREKVGVKVRFFLGLSQRTRADFLSELLCVTIAGEVSLLDDVTPIFYRTEVSAHGRFFVVSSSEKRSERFYIGAKVSAHKPIFTPIFCRRQKIGPCALGISVSASDAVGHGLAPRPGHTKDHHKNGTNCLPACAKGRNLTVQPDCLKGLVVCGTVYGDMDLKYILGSFARVGYCIPVPDFYLVLHGL